MWVRLWLTFSVSTVWSQQISTVAQDGASFEWEWQVLPLGSSASATTGHYYVRLPESEQQVLYAADASGYHGAVSVNTNSDHHAHTANVAIGRKAVELNRGAQNVYEKGQIVNATQMLPVRLTNNQHSTDLYVLKPRHYPPYFKPNPRLQSQTIQTNPSSYILQNQYNDRPNGNSKPLREEDHNEYRPQVLQVFKNQNCSKEKISQDLKGDLETSKQLFAEVPSFDLHDINNFSATTTATTPYTYTYRGAVHFRVETPRPNARNERFYYTTIETPTATHTETSTQDGIDKLVSSTQDLISNEDLLVINHAAEKQVDEQTDDIIKPRTKFAFKQNDHTGQDSRTNRFTVRAKIENIVKNENEDLDNQESLRPTSNQYDFASPIVVQDISQNNFREQIVNNLVSTMVPYMENGYQLVDVRDNIKETQPNHNSNLEFKELVNVTPRPIHKNYLTPITVAVRLLNDNDTDSFNTLDDHEASDSELVSDTVQSPPKEKTIVEVQKSIPVEITHINDVEVHDYIEVDEERSNNKGAFDMAKVLYTKYLDTLASSTKIQDNLSKILSKFGAKNVKNLFEKNRDSEEDNKGEEQKDNLEPSENIQSEVEVYPNQEDIHSHRIVQWEYGNDSQKIIQPIVIEKEIPVTKFVDRYIEKKVPYPQPIHVPVDRPVPYQVEVEKIVEKPVEITKYVDRPYPVEVHQLYPFAVKVPYPVEQKVYVDRPIHVPYPVEKIVEKQVLHPVPIPTPVGIPYEVPVPVEHNILYPVPIDRPVPVKIEVEKPVERIVNKEVPVPYPVEKRIPYPVHYETKVPVPVPVEKRIPVPVEKIIEKPVTITKYIDKPVHIQVPVPHPVPVAVPVPQPYPVDRIVEKKVPYPVPVDRIVEKKIPVQVLYPVEKVVEKFVEKPAVMSKYIDNPYPFEKQVPYTAEKNVYPSQVPAEVKSPYPIEKNVGKPFHVPIPGYRYEHTEQNSETRSTAHYQNYKEDKNKRMPSQHQINLAHYYQLLRDRQKQQVESTMWGNQYASSYQYINNTTGKKPQENNFTYPTNVQTKANQYHGPVPIQNQDDWWQNNKNYVVAIKMRRADREPKLSNLRIEYGGFQPPLIPSTEVDINGMPIHKDT